MSSSAPSAKDNYLPQNINFIKDIGPEHKKFLEDAAMMINRKDTGQYDLNEHVINQEYFGATPQKTRSIYRKVIAMGALLNAAPTTVLHGLNGGAAVPNSWRFVRSYGWAVNPTTPVWIAIPNGGIHDCSLQVTGTQVIITPTVNLAAFTECYVVLEYWKA